MMTGRGVGRTAREHRRPRVARPDRCRSDEGGGSHALGEGHGPTRVQVVDHDLLHVPTQIAEEVDDLASDEARTDDRDAAGHAVTDEQLGRQDAGRGCAGRGFLRDPGMLMRTQKACAR